LINNTDVRASYPKHVALKTMYFRTTVLCAFSLQITLTPQDHKLRLLPQGAVVGGIKQIPNQIMNHAVETSGKVVLALAAGAAFTAAAAI
jgi:hypothetical protein